MKRKILKKIMLISLLCLTHSNLMAQNNVWLMPNNDGTQGYWEAGNPFTTPLPTTDPDNNNQPYTDPYVGYVPDAANFLIAHKGSANAITNADGELLFFIVGSSIYDDKGRTIWTDYFGQYSITSGYTEISVVKDPGNCNRYYLFADRSGVDLGAEETYNARPYYAILDISQSHNTNSAYNLHANGTLVNFDGTFDQNTGFKPLLNEFDMLPSTLPKFDGVSYAVSKLNTSDNSRTVLVKISTRTLGPQNLNGNGILKIKLDANGMTNVGTTYFLQPGSSSSITDEHAIISDVYGLTIPRTEFELFEKANGNIIVALPIENTLMVYELDANLANVPNSVQYIYTVANPAIDINPINISGMEFSPNGRYIYFTHEPTTFFNNRVVDCWDLQTNSFVTLPWSTNINFSNSIDSEFQYSFIEGQNGKLYMPVADKLAEISNVDNPTLSSINETYLQINYLANYWEKSYAFWNGNGSAQHEGQFKRYTLPDQIDGENYQALDDLSTPEGRACCLVKAKYDVETFEANTTSDSNFTSTTQVWTPTNNPLNGGNGNVVYVREAINIPAGYIVTIKDMIIKFHPDAEVNVERGAGALKGGNLTIRNSTLTVDDRCDDNLFWQGVDVEGYPTLSQVPLNNTQQGQLFVFLNSTVERAYIGAEAIQNNIYGGYDVNYVGGVIRSSGSTWRNNGIDIKLQNNGPQGSAVNPSTISTSKFVTDMYMPAQQPFPKYVVHVLLINSEKVYIQGNEFINEVPTYFSENRRGFGVLSFNSKFIVRPYGFTQIPSKFSNLTYGVYASVGSAMKSSIVEKSTFMNNQFGVRYIGMSSGRITQNYFEVAENNNGDKTCGIQLQNCTGYKVEGNNLQSMLNTPENGESYGIVVNNSGQADNFIYRNTMGDLKVGGQSELENAPPSSSDNDANGLKWQCNDFVSNVSVADLTLTSGRIDYEQGRFVGSPPYSITDLPKFAGARNRFSHDNTTTEFDIAVNIGNTESFTYAYYNNYPITEPLNGIYTYQQVAKVTVTNDNYVFNYEESCPNRIRTVGPIINIVNGPKQKKEEIETLNSIVNNSGQNDMLNAIAGNMNNGQLKNYILDHAPLISDEVLIAYIESNPPNGHLIQVLNSVNGLSQAVIDALNQNNALPGNLLNNYSQTVGVSAYNQVLTEIKYLTAEKNYLIDDAIGYFLLIDSVSVSPIDSVIKILSVEEDSKLRQQQLVDAYIYKKELSTAETKKDNIEQNYGVDNFTKLATERINNTYDVCVVTNIDGNSTSKAIVEGIADNTTDKRNADKAKCYLYDFLKADGISIFIEDIIIDGVVRGMVSGGEEEISFEESTDLTVSIYPNPTTGLISVNITGLDDNEINTIEIVNVMGEMVYSETVQNSLFNVDLSNLPKGMYFVYVRTASNILKLEKIVVE